MIFSSPFSSFSLLVSAVCVMFVVFTEPVFSVLLFSFFSLVFSGKKNSAVALAGGLITLWTFNIYFTILNVKKTKKQWKQQPNKASTFLWMHAAQTYSLLLTHFIWRTRLPRHRKNHINILFRLEATIFAYHISLLTYSQTHLLRLLCVAFGVPK